MPPLRYAGLCFSLDFLLQNMKALRGIYNLAIHKKIGLTVKYKEILLCVCHVGCRGIDVGDSKVDVKEGWDNERVTKFYMA